MQKAEFLQSLASTRFLAMLLVLATLSVFGQVVDHGFVNYDDWGYVVDNKFVRGGLGWEGVRWALTTPFLANWHPLTWLSLMLDSELYGVAPWGYHWTNLLLHLANSTLLFLLLERMTGARWRSLVVAACFALHPLHVESVAWISERKGLLSGLFWMLTLFAYVRYTELRSSARYAGVAIGLALALASKPIAVTLPFVLLLLDMWPLGRMRDWISLRALIYEKIPLFVLVFLSCGITLWVQSLDGAVESLASFPMHVRLMNVPLAYMGYLIKFLWPSGLVAFYPHPGASVDLASVGLAALALVTISALSVREALRRPYLLVGWFWFLGTLVPVIGLVQAGKQSMADRYTYLPLIGLAILAAWGAHELFTARRRIRLTLIPSTVVTLVMLSSVSWIQVGHWRSTEDLFQHALDVDSNNAIAQFSIGQIRFEEGRIDEALVHYRESLRLDPERFQTHLEIGRALSVRGKLEQAMEHFQDALRIRPGYRNAHRDLAIILAVRGERKRALQHFARWLDVESDAPGVALELGVELARVQRPRESLHFMELAQSKHPEHFERSLRLKPLGSCLNPIGPRRPEPACRALH